MRSAPVAAAATWSSNVDTMPGLSMSPRPILALAKAPMPVPRNRGATSGRSRIPTTPIGPGGRTVTTPERTAVATCRY